MITVCYLHLLPLHLEQANIRIVSEEEGKALQAMVGKFAGM
jgi:hypothetical protein